MIQEDITASLIFRLKLWPCHSDTMTETIMNVYCSVEDVIM